MAEPTPVAPSPANGGSVQDDPTNLTPAPASEATTPQEDQPEQTSSEHTITLSEEDYKFWQNNGGAKKLMPSLKKWVGQPESRPQPAQPAEPAQAPAPQASAPVEGTKSTPQTPPAGTLGINEMVTKQYFKMLADDPKFANVSKELQDGTLVKDLSDFGVPLMVDGFINDAAIRRHVERYAATKPAMQPSVPESGAPTTSYTEATDGKVENYNQAIKIINENGNPNRAAAMKFLANMGRPAKK